MAKTDGGITEFQLTDNFPQNADIKRVFDKDGAFIVRNLLSKEEVKHVLGSFEGQPVMKKAFAQGDGEGGNARMLLWNQPGNDVTGMVARCHKMVDACEMALGGEVYHYHSKLSLKDEYVGGKFRWHQDYGYWYNNGILKPQLLQVLIALDRCTKENGCLQIIRGSSRCGRIVHHQVSGQMVADQEQVDRILGCDDFALADVPLEIGDAVFLSCTALHCSDSNVSPDRRWVLTVSYNRADNNPLVKHHHAQYTPLYKVPNQAILECEPSHDFIGKDVWDMNDENAEPNLSKEVFAKQVKEVVK